jgi:hypothetical protein
MPGEQTEEAASMEPLLILAAIAIVVLLLAAGRARRQTATAATQTVSAAHERVDLRGELPANAYRIIQGKGDSLATVEVVGESRYRSAIEAAAGKRADGHFTIVDAALVWEPENRYDPNAIAVVIGGRTCGYFPRDKAAAYRPAFAMLAERGLVGYARGEVRGGWRMDDGSWADFGIRIRLARPAELLAHIEASGSYVSRETDREPRD